MSGLPDMIDPKMGPFKHHFCPGEWEFDQQKNTVSNAQGIDQDVGKGEM